VVQGKRKDLEMTVGVGLHFWAEYGHDEVWLDISVQPPQPTRSLLAVL
jgi:hypothetical protein